MKKIMMLAVMAVMILGLSDSTFAQDATPKSKLSATSPMETAAVAFYFPSDGTKAVGLSHTILRISHIDIPKLTFDVDGTVAQEVTVDKNTLIGLGFKVNYNITKTDKTGFAFEPSIGVTALNDFTKYKTIQDVLANYKVAIYGNLLLYKW